MKRKNIVHGVKGARAMTVLLLVSLVISYIVAYVLSRMTASIMGYEALSRLTLSFLILVLLIWSLFLLLIKRYTRIQQWLKTELSKKETMIRGIVLTITILAIIIGCGALAGLFTEIIYFRQVMARQRNRSIAIARASIG